MPQAQAVDPAAALGRGTLVGLPPPPDDPDLPAESFRLPLEDVLDWVSRNAVVSPYGMAAAPPPPNFRVAFHGGRYPKPTRVPIIGLPHNIQSPRYLDLQIGRRQPCASGRLFPKGCGDASGGSGRTTVPETEPTSPKVSCFGTVLPDRDQGRRRHRGDSAARDVTPESSSSSVATPASAWEAAGFWASVLGFTCCRQRPGAAALLGDQASAGSSTASTAATREILTSVPFPEETTVMAAPTPGLGGMRRFTSGRRAASWGGDLPLAVDAADRSTRRAAAVFPGRRSVDSLGDLERECESERHGGAASV